MASNGLFDTRRRQYLFYVFRNQPKRPRLCSDCRTSHAMFYHHGVLLKGSYPIYKIQGPLAPQVVALPLFQPKY